MNTETPDEPKVKAAMLTSFAFNSAALRVGLINGEPHFVAVDVCNCLGLSKHRDAVARVPEWARGMPVRVDGFGENRPVMAAFREPLSASNFVDAETSAQGGRGYAATVTEAGVYLLAFRSNTPDAQAFQRWVCEEVLQIGRAHV